MFSDIGYSHTKRNNTPCDRCLQNVHGHQSAWFSRAFALENSTFASHLSQPADEIGSVEQERATARGRKSVGENLR
jgi:hypothetical protein